MRVRCYRWRANLSDAPTAVQSVSEHAAELLKLPWRPNGAGDLIGAVGAEYLVWEEGTSQRRTNASVSAASASAKCALTLANEASQLYFSTSYGAALTVAIRALPFSFLSRLWKIPDFASESQRNKFN